MRIDLNCDLGETVGGQPTADDAAMFPLISSANIACGFHAGDAESMRVSCARAVKNGVAIGAHVSYRDPDNFGRTDMDLPAGTLIAQIDEQIGTLRQIADAEGATLRYVKPHGALYNRIARDADVAATVIEAILARGDDALPILGLPASRIAAAASLHRIPFIREAFVDRGYRPDGSLVPRTEPGALLAPDDVADRAIDIVLSGGVTAVSGERLALDVDSLCVHGDTPGAVSMATSVRRALTDRGVEIRAVDHV
ncbi:5-oxoprolinase subunit PxpA [Paramicrobacterium sp. CJ85]|uniref:5-oxoprolinase subunit PxpA n=1 Tax=Paramicrobacterium sp. CJ85 TaxID=3445355 RepID=UPI003F63588A